MIYSILRIFQMICFRADNLDWNLSFWQIEESLILSVSSLQLCKCSSVYFWKSLCSSIYSAVENSSLFLSVCQDWTDSQLPLQLIVHCALLRVQWNLQLEGGPALRRVTSQKPPLLLGNPQPQSLLLQPFEEAALWWRWGAPPARSGC